MPRMTMSDLHAYQARRSAKVSPLYAGRGCDDEAELHRQILEECKRRGWIALHGSMAHSTFRTPGEWDVTVIGSQTETWCDGTGPSQVPRIWLIEAKTRTGKLSPAQQAIHAWARKLGHTVHVVRSFEEFLAVISTPSHP